MLATTTGGPALRTCKHEADAAAPAEAHAPILLGPLALTKILLHLLYLLRGCLWVGGLTNPSHELVAVRGWEVVHGPCVAHEHVRHGHLEALLCQPVRNLEHLQANARAWLMLMRPSVVRQCWCCMVLAAAAGKAHTDKSFIAGCKTNQCQATDRAAVKGVISLQLGSTDDIILRVHACP